MKKTLLLSLGLMTMTASVVAQTFDLTSEIRPRYEFRNAYKTLKNPAINGGNFISQRTRLNFGFKNEKLTTYVSMQNVRVWGDVGTLSKDDNATALHEAWAEAKLFKNISLKLGRQEIVYDDSRIFGNVGWAQQARSHDAALVKYTPNKDHKFEFGFALNSDSEENKDNFYSNKAGYKTFQYIYYNGKLAKNMKISVLVLNTGVEYILPTILDTLNQEIDNMQTIGPRIVYEKNKLFVEAATYAQIGEFKNINVNAVYGGINIKYQLNDNFNISVGMEYMSGKSMNDTTIGIKSFAPLFGTNHKFNGYMDYFYVGNHKNSVGLQDIHATVKYTKGKFMAQITPHLFSAAAGVYDTSGNELSANLGTEIDLVLGYKVSKDITFKLGYSQMFATKSMEAIKAGSINESNNFAWIMFSFKPKLFSHTIIKK